MDKFIRIILEFMRSEYSRDQGDCELLTENSSLEDGDWQVDEIGKENLAEFIADKMEKKALSSSSDSLFHTVVTVKDLYEKLLLAEKGFDKFIGAELSDEDEPSGRNDNNAKQDAPVPSKTVAEALAKLIDAGEDAGEDVLEQQLSLVKPVQVTERTHSAGKCIECEDRKALLDCVECGDEFCAVCFAALHRKGNRQGHTTVPKPGEPPLSVIQERAAAASKARSEAEEVSSIIPPPMLSSGNGTDPDLDFTFRAQFIPVRLEHKERRFLRLLQAQLSVSTYTDAIDKPNLQSSKRVHAQILKICAFLSGLAVSVRYDVGQQAVSTRKWKEHEKFFQNVMELGRRHKVLNPDRMRTEYGRLMYLMMDATRNEVQQLLGFNVNSPMVTVYSYLKERGAEAMLADPMMEIATRAIDQMSDDGKKSRHDIRSEVKQKEHAVKTLARKYRNGKIDEEELKWCLYSVGDNRSFLLQHRDPVQRMIRYLKRYFGPDANVEPAYSLAIYGGQDGSRLTHTHEKQYNYVLQSLSLWREILNDMFRLWCLAEEDMLDPACPYTLQDTGQGFQRVQAAPRVAKAMRDLLFRTQSQLGSWVGSSVVHLGDKNVPNALQFLDKYTQVAHILAPIVICLDRLPEMCEHEKTAHYIDTVFGGIEKCRKDILVDFFRSAFDGSGADNFFDAGSCIDGRLTSAWNWCSQISTKRFFPVLKLSGFSSFDGTFEE